MLYFAANFVLNFIHMIPRYSRAEMAEIWSDQSRFEIWLEVELLALQKMVDEGLAHPDAYKVASEKAKFETQRVLEIEQEVQHDVIAFLTNVAEHVGPMSRFIHRGMTSSDLLDTTLAVQLMRAGNMILRDLDAVLDAILKRAEEFKYTACIGRSHGIHAEPITFGLKLMTWYAEVKRSRVRIEAAIKEISYGKIAGAVGTYASVPPSVELHVMNKLGLKPETVSTQIVHRDRHAAFFNALALCASSLERFCVEIRHLQRTEVREAEEKFAQGQKGSSAMPHKRNPVLTENLSGLARLMRSYALAAMENVPLWHERDISHSSVERVIGPDACILMDFMLKRFKNIVSGLVVYPDKMRKNLEATNGIVFSGTLLIRLADKGMSREDAYKLTQTHALNAWEGGESFPDRVRKDPQVAKYLAGKELEEVFDLKRHFQYVDLIFDRAKAA